MNHDGLLDNSNVELNMIEANIINPQNVKYNIKPGQDDWAHTQELDPEKILINEKTVYAVDQAMNVVITDANGYVLYGNQNIFDLTLYSPAELIGGHTRIFNANYHSKEFFQEMWNTIKSGKIWRGDLKNKRKDGAIIWVRLIITPLLNNDGVPYQFVALKEDITEKKEIEFQLAQKDKQLSALTYNSYDIVGIINQYGEITYLNPAFERVLGFPSFETIGSNLVSFLVDDDLPFWSKMLKEIIKQPTDPIRHQLKIKHKSGSIRWCDVAFTNYLDDPHIKGIVFNFRDITNQKEANDRINHLAHFDFLTGLPNRRHFEHYLQESLLSTKNTDSMISVWFCDLDGFKHINDTLGHDIGDGLLSEVGKRIQQFFEGKAFVARLGGDEFAIVMPNSDDFNQLNDLADKLINAINQPFTVDEYHLNISASIGISTYPMAGEDMKTLVKNADVAMYQAKHDGKNHFQMYIPSMDQNSYKSFIIKNDLNYAIEKNQLFVMYQPRIHTKTNKIVGAEALIRWDHPKLGLVSHSEFIPFAEESGFIIPLGNWIIKDVCLQLKRWQSIGLPPIKVSVNISVKQLIHPKFSQRVKQILDETGLDPKWLEIEITEGVLLHKEGQAILSLQDLKKQGISITLDNFGAGYSAFNYLIKYDFDVIKIDRSIFENIHEEPHTFEIANAIINLAKRLNKKVVAEGIETQSQMDELVKTSCDEFQGFIFSKPVTAHDFVQFLESDQLM
ncbi:sensor domain-containing protein [Bacillus marasmi]|uniref:sensor domain-containing protein n=1 Tax=Bacillus marasmi TaxID=1926279 RepID=UPI0011C7677F|nr:bifunctional diguanylate cyclase/phosphodiesterase [Bacillus marasmi]